MKAVDNLLTVNDIKSLREGIQNKYKQYHHADPSRFPDIGYNTNRANYAPLRDSFEEEFYVTRGIDRTSSTIHIPSTNTLVLLFTNDSYVPGRRILNTCQSYAEGKSKVSVKPVLTVPTQTETTTVQKSRRILVGGLVVLVSLGVMASVSQWFFAPVPSGLVIERPTPRSTVPQQLIVEGKVTNAETVWLAVRYEKGFQYWVQPPIKVQDNGWWIGVIFVGGVAKADEDLTYQIRAFVNPTKALKSGDVLHSWPEAELSSGVMDVVRGPKLN